MTSIWPFEQHRNIEIVFRSVHFIVDWSGNDNDDHLLPKAFDTFWYKPWKYLTLIFSHFFCEHTISNNKQLIKECWHPYLKISGREQRNYPKTNYMGEHWAVAWIWLRINFKKSSLLQSNSKKNLLAMAVKYKKVFSNTVYCKII